MDKKRTGESLKDLFKGEVGSKELKSQDTKELKRRRTTTFKRHDAKTSDIKIKPRRHTIYLSPEQSKKLRLYAAKNDMQLSEVIEKLIDDNL